MPGDIGVKLTGDNTRFRKMLNESTDQIVASTSRWGEFGKSVGVTDGQLTKMGAKFGLIGASLFAVVKTFQGVLEYAEKTNAAVDSNMGAAKRLSEGVRDAGEGMRSLKDSAMGFGAYWLGAVARVGEYLGRQAAVLAYGEQQVKQGEAVQQQMTETLAALERDKALTAEIGAIRKQIADVEKKAAEEAAKRLDFADKLVAALGREANAQQALIAAEGDRLGTIKAQLELAQASAELAKLRGEEGKRLAEEEKKAAEARAKADAEQVSLLRRKAELQFEALSTQEKIARYEESIRTLTDEIVKGKKAGIAVDDLEVALLENQAELGRLRVGLAKEQNRAERDNVVSAEELEKLTRRDLELQADAIKARIAKAAAEGQVTEALLEQLAVVERILAKKKDELTITLKIRGVSYEQQTEASLRGALDRAKSELQRLGEDQSFRTAFAPNAKDPRFYTLQQEVARMENELKMRQQVSTYAARFGEDAARYQYGDTATDRALRDMKDEAVQTRVTLQNISTQLAASGLFPKS